MLGNGGIGHVDVATKPYQCACRGGKHKGTPQHNQCAVDDRGVKRLPKLGRTIGWKFEMEGGNLAAKDGSRQQPRTAEHETNAHKHHRHHRYQRNHAAISCRNGCADKQRGQQYLCGPAAIA